MPDRKVDYKDALAPASGTSGFEEQKGVPVRIQKPGDRPVTVVLHDMHSWLDRQEIRPLHFQYFPTLDGEIAYYFLFRTEEEADKFKAQFDGRPSRPDTR